MVVAVEAMREAAQATFANVLTMSRRHQQTARFELNHRIARPAAIALHPAFLPLHGVALGIPSRLVVTLAFQVVPLRFDHLIVNDDRPLPGDAGLCW